MTSAGGSGGLALVKRWLSLLVTLRLLRIFKNDQSETGREVEGRGRVKKKRQTFTKSNYNHFFIISGKHQESLNS